MTDQPYEVTNVRHERSFKPDGTVGDQYHVKIKHASGVESSFTVPDEGNVALAAHHTALRHVANAQAIMKLPAGMEGVK